VAQTLNLIASRELDGTQVRLHLFSSNQEKTLSWQYVAKTTS